ncbi:MAG: hypothetical protein HY962_10275 [Ignavibacteriae bacterium]|nr:hypothetical protein [Ignavibacteriota bacterium]
MNAQTYRYDAWRILIHAMWDQYEYYDTHSDGAGSMWYAYKQYNASPSQTSIVNLAHYSDFDKDALHIRNLSIEDVFRVVDQGPRAAFLVWLSMTGSTAGINIHLLRSNGERPFGLGGVSLPGTAGAHKMDVARGAEDGLVLVWSTSSSLRAQMLDRRGASLWSGDGADVASAIHATTSIQDIDIVAAPGGGAYVGWIEIPAGGGGSVCRVQRLGIDGARTWSDSGIAVGTTSGIMDLHCLAADGDGGLIVSWLQDSAVYLQYITDDGKPKLANGGFPLGDARRGVRVASDAKGGMLTFDGQSVRRYGPGLRELWGGTASIFTPRPYDETRLRVSPDGKGGALGVWIASPGVIMMQWIDSTGRRRFDGRMALVWYTDWYTVDLLEPVAYATQAAIFRWTTRTFFGHRELHFAAFVDSSYSNPLDSILTEVRETGGVSGFSFGLTPTPAHGHGLWSVSLERAAHVRIDLFDVHGRHAATLWNGTLPEGTQHGETDFNGIAPGVYFATCIAGNQRRMQRLLLLR